MSLRTVCLAALGVGALGNKQCVHGQRGPACNSDSDCKDITDCVRCAHSGFCTDLSPGPGPRPQPGGGGCTANNKSYDFLLLVQGWPRSGCISTHCESSYSSIDDRFVMHGLWPSRGGKLASSYPCQCDTRAFDESQVSPIMDQLKQNWPSFKPGNGFWDHEWTKHGTCSSDVPTLSTELTYFNTTLSIREGHNIFDGLKQAGIVPSDTKTYTAQQIIAALKPVGKGFEPMIGCVEQAHVQYLHEAAFCLDRDLNNVQCDEGLKHLPHDEVSDCDPNTPITYIASVPTATLETIVV